MNLTLYGKRSTMFKCLKDAAIDTAQQADIDLSIIETTDTDKIIQMGIPSIPAYSLNQEISSKGMQEFDQFVDHMKESILRGNTNSTT